MRLELRGSDEDTNWEIISIQMAFVVAIVYLLPPQPSLHPFSAFPCAPGGYLLLTITQGLPWFSQWEAPAEDPKVGESDRNMSYPAPSQLWVAQPLHLDENGSW